MPEADERDRTSRGSWSELTIPEITVYIALALFVTAAFVLRTGMLDLDSRALIDTDGYMRYLRIDELRSSREWFDTVAERSNYPYGESQHWTRPLDVYVLLLSLILRPFLGGDSLYGASVLNAPLLLVGVGFTTYWAFAPRLSSGIRPILLPLTLAFPLIVGYSAAGRVDHHAAILLMFVLTIGSLIRLLDTETAKVSIGLVVSLTFGMWLSTEYLVPMGLVALLLGVVSLLPGQGRIVAAAAQIFFITSFSLLLAVMIERGREWGAIEYDRVSLAHPALALAIAVVFRTFMLFRSEDPKSNVLRFGIVGAGVALPLAIALPGLVGGPFVDVAPVVRDVWLYRVDELKPIWEGRSWNAILIVIGPVITGLMAGAWQLLRSGYRPWLAITAGWLAFYGILTAAQLRWALFAHLLSLPLILKAIETQYHRFDGRPLAVVLRPVAIVGLIAGMSLVGGRVSVGFGSESSIGSGPGSSSTSCDLSDVLPTLTRLPRTTVMAEQDAGPEILYRTRHRVIATPYHRNEAGILYPRAVMSLSSSDTAAIRSALDDREVGVILVCPGRIDIMQPNETSGTFYESLVAGPRPSFVQDVALSDRTDYLLFTVED